jgi:hypothetical protein
VATYVPIHGAGDGAWHWHLVAAELRERGHDVVADEIDGGHCVYLCRPAELAARLESLQ